MSSSSSNNKRRRISSCAFVGPPPKVLSDKKTLRFVFRDFPNLNEKNGEDLESESLEAHGHMWCARVYPRGMKRKNDGYVSFFFFCDDSSEDNQVKAKLTFQFRGPIATKTREYDFAEKGFGYGKVSSRRDILLDCLDSEGSFIVNVDVQIYVEKKSVWYPKRLSMNTNRPIDLGRKLLESKLGSDVTFLVGQDGHKAKFEAHRNVVSLQAPAFFEFIEDLKSGEVFEIPYVDSDTFKMILEYIYIGCIPEDGLLNKREDDDAIFDHAKNLLVAFSRFCLVDLKLFIESEITAILLNIENAAEWLPIADSYNCPLLKEECMNLFQKDKVKFKRSSGWKHIQESPALLEELLFYNTDGGGLSDDNSGNDDDDDGVDYDAMSVGMLRERLESNELELDGTKKMLIKRLKDFSTEQESAHSD